MPNATNFFGLSREFTKEELQKIGQGVAKKLAEKIDSQTRD